MVMLRSAVDEHKKRLRTEYERLKGLPKAKIRTGGVDGYQITLKQHACTYAGESGTAESKRSAVMLLHVESGVVLHSMKQAMQHIEQRFGNLNAPPEDVEVVDSEESEQDSDVEEVDDDEVDEVEVEKEDEIEEVIETDDEGPMDEDAAGRAKAEETERVSLSEEAAPEHRKQEVQESEKVLQEEAEGWRLHLSSKSSTGYKGVRLQGNRYLVFSRQVPGHKQRRIGSSGTAVEAALAYARSEDQEHESSDDEQPLPWAVPEGLVVAERPDAQELVAGSAEAKALVGRKVISRPLEPGMRELIESPRDRVALFRSCTIGRASAGARAESARPTVEVQ